MRFRRLAAMGILAFSAATFHSQNACSIQKKRDFYGEAMKEPVRIEPLRRPKATDKKPVISARWSKGRCSLVGHNEIVYKAGKKTHTLSLVQPIYEGRERPLDMTCSSKRTIILTSRKVVIMPGYDSVKDSGEKQTTTALVQQFDRPAKLGIVSGEIEGKNIYLITKNRQLWYTNIDDPDGTTAFNLADLTPGTKGMEVHRDVLFIVQNAPARGDFLLAIAMDGQDIILKRFADVRGCSGKIRIVELGDHLELRIGDSVHMVKVGEPGKVNSISVTAGN